MGLRRRLASWEHTLRYGGPRALGWKAIERGAEPIGQIGLESIWRKDLTLPLTEFRARVDVDIGPASESDIDQIVDLVRSNWNGNDDYGPYTELGYRGTVASRFQHGQKCFVAKIGADIVHYNWIALDREEAIAGTGLVATLAEGRQAICHDGFTVEARRGLGVHPAVNNAMLKWLQDSGYRTAYTVVGTLDRSSNIAHHRLDWEFSGVMLYLIPKKSKKARVWTVKGTLAPFEPAV